MKQRRKRSSLLDKIRVDRRGVAFIDLSGAEVDKDYWLGQTPLARLAALELMRRIKYGAAATGRMEKVFEVVRPTAKKRKKTPAKPKI